MNESGGKMPYEFYEINRKYLKNKRMGIMTILDFYLAIMGLKMMAVGPPPQGCPVAAAKSTPPQVHQACCCQQPSKDCSLLYH